LNPILLEVQNFTILYLYHFIFTSYIKKLLFLQKLHIPGYT